MKRSDLLAAVTLVDTVLTIALLIGFADYYYAPYTDWLWFLAVVDVALMFWLTYMVLTKSGRRR